MTTDDIDGLAKWKEIFGQGHQAIFVFVYRTENIDVDYDGKEVYNSNDGRYIFFCIKLIQTGLKNGLK